MTAGVDWRPEGPNDAAFLQALAAAYKRDNLIAIGLPPAVVDQMLPFQTQAHLAGITGETRLILMRGGRSIGRMVLRGLSDGLHLSEILLTPDQRNRGLGTFVLTRLLRQVADNRQNLRLFVDPTNPARRLYLRLGFQDDGLTGPQMVMTWRAADHNVCLV